MNPPVQAPPQRGAPAHGPRLAHAIQGFGIPAPSSPTPPVQIPTGCWEKARPEVMAFLGFQPIPSDDGAETLYLCPPHLKCEACSAVDVPCQIHALKSIINHTPSNGMGRYIWGRVQCTRCFRLRSRVRCNYHLDNTRYIIDWNEPVQANRLKVVSPDNEEEDSSEDEGGIAPRANRRRVASPADETIPQMGRALEVYTIDDTDEEDNGGQHRKRKTKTGDNAGAVNGRPKRKRGRPTLQHSPTTGSSITAITLPDSDDESDAEDAVTGTQNTPTPRTIPNENTHPVPKLDYAEVGKLTATKPIVPATVVDAYLKLLGAADPSGFVRLPPSILQRDGNQAFWTTGAMETFHQTPHTVIHPILFEDRWWTCILWPPMRLHGIYTLSRGAGVKSGIRKVIGMKTIEMSNEYGPGSNTDLWGQPGLITSNDPKDGAEGNGGIECLALARVAHATRLPLGSLDFKKRPVEIGRRLAADLIRQCIGDGFEAFATGEDRY